MTHKSIAWLNLAWHFARHLLLRLPWRRLRRGRDLRRLDAVLQAEGYIALDPAARIEFPRYMGCVHCGLCAIACEPLQRAPHSAWDEAWTFVVGGSRSLDQAALVGHDLSQCSFAVSAERVCPTGVPINHMAATIRAMAES